MFSVAASRPVLSQPQGFAAPADGWDFVWTPAASSGMVTRPAAYHRAVATPHGLALEAAGNTGLGAAIAPSQDPNWNFGTGPFALLCVFRITEQIAGNAERPILGSSDLTNHLKVYVRSNAAAYTLRASCGLTSSTDYTVAVGDTVALAVGRDAAGNVRLQYRDLTTGVTGVRSATNTGAWYLRVAGADLRVLGYAATGFPGQVLAVAMRRSHVDDFDALLLNPWGVFRSSPSRVYADTLAGGGAVHLLSGGAVSRASGFATLTGMAVGLAGVARSVASAVGGLTAGIRLVGMAGARATVSGALGTALSWIGGAAGARAGASASLRTAIRLGGAARAHSGASAWLFGVEANPPSRRIWCARIVPRMLRLSTRWMLQV